MRVDPAPTPVLLDSHSRTKYGLPAQSFLCSVVLYPSGPEVAGYSVCTGRNPAPLDPSACETPDNFLLGLLNEGPKFPGLSARETLGRPNILHLV
jgi:hypothetical protein